MKLIYWAIIGIGLFIAVWFLFVVPAERRHHERKLEVIRKRLEKRRTQANEGNPGTSTSEEQAKES
ncbi:MAG: hypothetical protein R3192_13810 [Woeseiaceae bacterium]|nr:hypothetical protein [Woeseiaceae bacterium]